jgi:4-alpha-glucanotransferase
MDRPRFNAAAGRARLLRCRAADDGENGWVAGMDDALRQLAAHCGVATEFWDWQGRHVDVSDETVIAVLSALGIDAGTPEQAIAGLHDRWHEPWTRMLPACVVTRQASGQTFWVHVSHGDWIHVWIDLETGGVRRDLLQVDNWWPAREVGGRLIGEASYRIPDDLPLGYHTVRARSSDREAATSLIITPAWVGFPERMGARRSWGLATQLYSVRSAQSWGIGDLTDLTDLAVWVAAEHDAGFVLVNPLHAAEPAPPMEPSPYLPTSRRFANPIYLRIERIPEYAQLDEDQRAQVDELRRQVHEKLDSVDGIDRDTAWSAKRAALEAVYGVPLSAGREVAFRAYQHREGDGLVDFATWCALADVHGPDWRRWPESLRHPARPDVGRFRAEHNECVQFHMWLQWVLDEQLDAAQAAAVRAGMVLGIMHDLAVGVNPAGADAWSLQDVLAQQISVGAPPDAFNQLGQDWQQPPWRPDQLAELAYAPFRSIVSTVLRHSGGVRVDHIIGLFRLWWIPSGMPATAGTYVTYDHEALVGILALEAHRARVVIVGEDVGTVEPWVRTYLRERGVLGTSILWFEFDYHGDGAPLAPERWREYCLASVTTHDLPPTAGYLAGDHVRLRESLGVLTRSVDEELTADAVNRDAWLAALHDREALAPDADVQATVAALHRLLTWTPARLICVALTDAVGDRRTQNQPGTIDEYPNWRVPLAGPDGKPMLLEDVFRSRRAAALMETVREV